MVYKKDDKCTQKFQNVNQNCRELVGKTPWKSEGSGHMKSDWEI